MQPKIIMQLVTFIYIFHMMVILVPEGSSWFIDVISIRFIGYPQFFQVPWVPVGEYCAYFTVLCGKRPIQFY